jgi:hypothetical protein
MRLLTAQILCTLHSAARERLVVFLYAAEFIDLISSCANWHAF